MYETLADLIYEHGKAKKALEKAEQSCDSSRGYWLYDEIERVNSLSNDIDRKVRELAKL